MILGKIRKKSQKLETLAQNLLINNNIILHGIKNEKFLKKLKKVDGQSLAEFAVTTAMMATLATTAAPKFSGVGEGAKEKKTMADMDKIMKSANNFYNEQVTTAGRGRFPGQEKYNEPCPTNGGYTYTWYGTTNC